ncbi:hypothetical protein EG347_02595 [Chryseobacterium sp. G0186]|uniref:hypothetical protein n=1 Tax=Chryseobacterium sp. G0186 TaxID=2487064 RepID=UPI000F507908|nr:hypothetical protein [Chryseobacterium sp. G0186]AZA76489.1 hypothetical protein EG347_02595 [Chryseobacterium sp. G0186]
MENDFNIEIDKSSKKKIVVFILFFACIVLLTIIYLIINSNSSTKKQLLYVERYARVIELYNNKQEHNFPYVKYSNGTRKILEFPYKIGDSVSKKRGDSIEYIFRNDSVIVNNYFERARKDGYLN